MYTQSFALKAESKNFKDYSIELGLFSQEKRKLWGDDLISVYKSLPGGCKAGAAKLFAVVPSDRTRGSGGFI